MIPLTANQTDTLFAKSSNWTSSRNGETRAELYYRPERLEMATMRNNIVALKMMHELQMCGLLHTEHMSDGLVKLQPIVTHLQTILRTKVSRSTPAS
jgi:hypothetical protein